MKSWKRWLFILVLGAMTVGLVACEKPKKEGRLLVAEQEFVLRVDKENTFTIDARGKVRNVGDVDVKNVAVTGYCRSCDEIWIPGKWFVSDVEKMPEQKAKINYLPAGGEAKFNFVRVADMMLKSGQEPPGMPERLEVVIESFEVVE